MRPNTRRGDARGVGRLQAPSPSASSPASTSPTTRPSSGKKRELTAEDYVYSIKRHYDPRWKSPNLYLLENAKILGLSELRKKLIDEKKPFDYDTPVDGLRALDRYTLPDPPGRTRSALSVQPDRRFVHRRAGARGGRGLWRQDRRAPGGHRAFPAGRVEAQLAHRAGEEPELPRGAVRRNTAAPAMRGWRGIAAAVQGPAPAADRPGADLGHRRTAATLAVFPERRAGRGRERAGRVCQRRVPEQPAGAQPGQARHRHGALPARVGGRDLFRHGRPVGRRLRAAQGGAAPRHLAGGGRRPRDHAGAAQPGHSGAVADRTRHLGLRSRLQERDERIRPRARQGAARHARLCGHGRRRLARAARRLSRWCWNTPPAPTSKAAA